MFKKTEFDIARRSYNEETSTLRQARYRLFDANELEVGTNYNNEYVPTFSFFRRQNIVGIPDGYMYFKPNPGHTPGASKSVYDDLFAGMNDTMRTRYFIFVVDDVTHTLTVTNGYISDRYGNILLALCMKKYLRDFNPENFKLFVATEFMTDDVYKNVWKKVEKDYVSVVQKEGINVEYLQSKKLDLMLFTGAPEIKVRSISELEAHKKKMLEYFRWHATLDEGEYISGSDYYAPGLIKEGYTVNNIKASVPEFQPVLWRAITNGVYDNGVDEIVSFKEFIERVEKYPTEISHHFNVIMPGEESYLLSYNPRTQSINDLQREIWIKLSLTNSNLVRKYSENINDTILSLQNYVNFASSENENTEITANSPWTIRVPEGMEVTSDTPPEAIG